MKAIATIAATIVLTASANVVAAPGGLAVQTNDLDLATTNGQTTLARRIDRAARAVCAAEVLSQSPEMIRAERQCVKATKQSVATQIAVRSGVRTAIQ
jgi:UrcA family protein